MKWLSDEEVNKFINKHNYNIKENYNKEVVARWIDQKCTPDVLCIIADCIIEFCNSSPEKEYFTSIDIWHNQYTLSNVEQIFKKPNPNKRTAKNEYDKFFQQPMEMFAYAGVLEKKKVGIRNFYKIIDKDMLEYISIREMNALKFIYKYNEKVLEDSEIYCYFEKFFNNPNKNNYNEMKDGFALYMIENTEINKKLECNRIFTKILNPIAFMKNNYGTERGRLSKTKITKDMLMYNRNNFRDIYAEKPKEMTRTDYNQVMPNKLNVNLIKYQSTKAKKMLRTYNDIFRNGMSELSDSFAIGNATQMHHIFPESEFYEISGYIENIIALTPAQHYGEAHPNNNTRVIDKAFQQLCLIAKANIIESNIKEEKEVIYSFENFIDVLAIGLEDDRFKEVDDMDFVEVIRLINMDYVS